MQTLIRFGNCVIDVQARTLLKDGEPQSFEPKVFDVLIYLIANRDRVVPNQELLDTVWGRDVRVSSGVVARSVMKARRLTGEAETGRPVIKTTHRIGYRFVAELEQSDYAIDPSDLATAAVLALARRHLRIAILPFGNATNRSDLSWIEFGLMSKVIDALGSRNGTSVIAARDLLAVIGPQDQGLELQTLARKVRRAFGATDIVRAELREEDRSTLRLDYLGYGAHLSTLQGTLSDAAPLALAAALAREIDGVLNRSRGAPGARDAVDHFLRMTTARARQAIRAERYEAARKLLLVALDIAPSDLSLRLEHARCLAWLHSADAERCLEEVRARAHEERNRRLELWALHHLACHRYSLGQLSEAEHLLSHALRMAHEEKDLDAELQLLLAQSEALVRDGNASLATWTLDRAAQIARSLGDRGAIARSLDIRGQLAMLGGDLQAALPDLTRAVEFNRELGMQAGAAFSLVHLGSCQAGLGRLGRTLDCCEQALDHALKSGHPLAIGLAGLAAVECNGMSPGDPAKSAPFVARMRRANRTASAVLAAYCDLAGALVAARAGRPEEALLLLDRAEAAHHEHGFFGHLVRHRIRLLVCLDRLDEAAILCEQLRLRADRRRQQSTGGLILHGRALLAWARGHDADAVALLLESIARWPRSIERAMASLDALWICLEVGDQVLSGQLLAELQPFLDEAWPSNFTPAVLVRSGAGTQALPHARTLPSLIDLPPGLMHKSPAR